MKSIAVISHNYPSRSMPQNGAFVYNLVQELGKIQNIVVIAPFKITDVFKRKGKDYGPESCKVIRPLYLSLGNRRFLGLNLHKLTTWSHNWARNRALNSIVNKPSLIYCHFLSTGISVTPYVKKNKIPMIIASGESSYSHIHSYYSKQEIVDFFDVTDFIICVSASNQKQLEKLGYDPRKMKVLPNTVDFTMFQPKAKDNAKKALGIDTDKFVVGFIGHFIERKGPNRIIKAISLLNDDKITLVCVGNGGALIENNFTQIIPPVPNQKLPDIINAFDVFVLPTLSEGHCNVIEEAKACCVPIISSKGTTVETQIENGYNGFLINPLDINEIKEHILILFKNPELRKKMSNNLRLDRGGYSLNARAASINEIIEEYKK
ncbi:glycosyltransferase family 4 protein [Bizionia myxarmorum]|nr:glycosyltransferase family 4 protein [Bizionia myxarmorum]